MAVIDGYSLNGGFLELEHVAQVAKQRLAGDLARQVPIGRTQIRPNVRIERILPDGSFLQGFEVGRRPVTQSCQALVRFELAEAEMDRRLVPPLGPGPGHDYLPGADIADDEAGSQPLFENALTACLEPDDELAVECLYFVDVVQGCVPSVEAGGRKRGSPIPGKPVPRGISPCARRARNGNGDRATRGARRGSRTSFPGREVER